MMEIMNNFIPEDIVHRPFLEAAIQAAAVGANIARESQCRNISKVSKSLGDYVSEVDLRIDREISDIIRALFPDVKIISEELASTYGTLPADCWIVDPLDGTNSYLAGARLELVSTMIALRLNGETVCSVVHFPFTDEVYLAAKGSGAFRNGQRVRVPNPPLALQESWVALNHYGDVSLETDFLNRARNHLRQENGASLVTIDPPGSGLALRIMDDRDTLGAVIHDNNPKSRKQEIWDVIPIQLIIEEAGGVYLNDKGQPYDPLSIRPIVIANSESMAGEIFKKINSSADA